jgi:hypothetical protein
MELLPQRKQTINLSPLLVEDVMEDHPTYIGMVQPEDRIEG